MGGVVNKYKSKRKPLVECCVCRKRFRLSTRRGKRRKRQVDGEPAAWEKYNGRYICHDHGCLMAHAVQDALTRDGYEVERSRSPWLLLPKAPP